MSTSLCVLLLALVAIVFGQDGTAIWKQPPDNTCATWGDPHIWTWDGNHYSTQGSGYFHLVVSDKINIQARFDYGCGGNDVTCVYGFRVFTVNQNNEIHSFELKANLVVDGNIAAGYRRPFEGYGLVYKTTIDGADAHMVPAVNGGDADLVREEVYQSLGLAGAGKVAYFTKNRIYSINFKFNDIVIQFLPWTISITPLNPSGSAVNELKNNVCGLCGTFSDNKGDDFYTRNSQYISTDSNPDLFSLTWRVTAQDAVNGYFSCNGGPSPTQKPTPGPGTPTSAPTALPTRGAPTSAPPTDVPTDAPTDAPTAAPTAGPSSAPTTAPTARPTNPATARPTNPPVPTVAPTPFSSTGYVTTGDSTTGSGNGNQTTNITIIVNEFNGTQAFTDANTTCCEDAHICPGDPFYNACMMDVLKTNRTSLAVSSTGAIVLAGCARTNITDSSCTQGTLFACPGACAGAGSCVAGACICRKGFKNDNDGSCIAVGLTQAQIIAVGVSAGIVAAIVIGAVVFLALAGFGAKKGYDYYHMKDNKMANVNSNPLYNEKKTGGVSPLYADKA